MDEHQKMYRFSISPGGGPAHLVGDSQGIRLPHGDVDPEMALGIVRVGDREYELELYDEPNDSAKRMRVSADELRVVATWIQNNV